MNKVYLVGAGPGGRGLVTVKGLEILRQADVVIYDYLVDKRLLEEAKEGAELICCDKLGKGKYSDGFPIHQEKIHNLMIEKAREGKKVIRLKNGDPAIFSRLSQELDALVRARIEFEIVPGVTAASASSASSGIPLTDRRFASSCVFVTGHEDPAKKTSLLEWEALAKNGTMIFYMGVEKLSGITKRLREAGKRADTPIALIQDAGLITQKTITGTLKDIAVKVKQEKARPPAIIIIGEVARLEKRFDWLKKSKRILFTGLSKERFFIKGTYFHLPLIKIEPMDDYSEFDGYLKDIRRFDWIVFSSRYGAHYFFERFKNIGRDSRALNGIKIAAIGNSTKEKLLEFGILADLVPEEESSEGLLKTFKKINIKGRSIFLPRSDISDKNLSDGFKKLGTDVVTSFVYRNVMARNLPDLDLDFFDEIMFTSPSGVRSFLKRYGPVPRGVKVSCIGDVTRREAVRCQLLDRED